MNKKCFVIMPFKEELSCLFERIKRICNEFNIDCKRSDEIAVGSITKCIIEEIFYADFIIADLTFSNPNVFYEIAISHCVGRKTILITQEDIIPFDLGQDFVIKYSNTIDGCNVLDRHLKEKIKHIINGGIIDNPAQMFLPKTNEEIQFEKLSDISKEILIALAESRKMEIEIVSEKSFMMTPESIKKVEEDLKKLSILIEKIRNDR